MAKKKKILIRWTETAVADFEEIYDYLAELSVDAADRWAKSVLGRVRRLGRFPLSGRLIPEVKSLGESARQVVVGNYRIFFQYRPPSLEILAIRHAARDVR